jgi:hypothetical protein
MDSIHLFYLFTFFGRDKQKKYFLLKVKMHLKMMNIHELTFFWASSKHFLEKKEINW